MVATRNFTPTREIYWDLNHLIPKPPNHFKNNQSIRAQIWESNDDEREREREW